MDQRCAKSPEQLVLEYGLAELRRVPTTVLDNLKLTIEAFYESLDTEDVNNFVTAFFTLYY